LFFSIINMISLLNKTLSPTLNAPNLFLLILLLLKLVQI